MLFSNVRFFESQSFSNKLRVYPKKKIIQAKKNILNYFDKINYAFLNIKCQDIMTCFHKTQPFNFKSSVNFSFYKTAILAFNLI